MRNKYYRTIKYRREVGNKLNNHKVEFDGKLFGSKREAHRYAELRLLERSGHITDLQTQVPFELIPAQYEDVPTGEYYKIGEKKGQPKIKRVCVEQSVVYVADFVYTENGKKVVEDTKGCRDGITYNYFVLKRKMMLYFHGIRVREV